MHDNTRGPEDSKRNMELQCGLFAFLFKLHDVKHLKL